MKRAVGRGPQRVGADIAHRAPCLVGLASSVSDLTEGRGSGATKFLVFQPRAVVAAIEPVIVVLAAGPVDPVFRHRSQSR